LCWRVTFAVFSEKISLDSCGMIGIARISKITMKVGQRFQQAANPVRIYKLHTALSIHVLDALSSCPGHQQINVPVGTVRKPTVSVQKTESGGKTTTHTLKILKYRQLSWHCLSDLRIVPSDKREINLRVSPYHHRYYSSCEVVVGV
jgi:hypothetical protein